MLSINAFRNLRNPLYYRREKVRKEIEKQERGKTKKKKRNEKTCTSFSGCPWPPKPMLSVSRRESVVWRAGRRSDMKLKHLSAPSKTVRSCPTPFLTSVSHIKSSYSSLLPVNQAMNTLYRSVLLLLLILYNYSGMFEFFFSEHLGTLPKFMVRSS